MSFTASVEQKKTIINIDRCMTITKIVNTSNHHLSIEPGIIFSDVSDAICFVVVVLVAVVVVVVVVVVSVEAHCFSSP